MAWGKAGSTTLEADDYKIDTTVSDSKFGMFLTHSLQDGTVDAKIQFGTDGTPSSSSYYSFHQRFNWGTEGVVPSSTNIDVGVGGYSADSFHVGFFSNISGEQKLIWESMANLGTAITFAEQVGGKYNDGGTNLPLNVYRFNEGGTATDIATGSNSIVLGSDLIPTVGKPTNVELSSRFEETDTRKMYNSTPTSVDTEDVYDEITGRTDVSVWITNSTPNWSNGEGRYIGLQIQNNAGGQALVGKGVKKIKVRLYRGTALTGTYRVGMMDSSGTVKGFSDHDASEVTGSSATYSHTMNNAVILAVGDIIFISYTATTNQLYLRTNNITNGFGSNYSGAFSPRSVTTGTTWVTSLDGDASRLWMMDFDFAPATDQSVPLTWQEIGT